MRGGGVVILTLVSVLVSCQSSCPPMLAVAREDSINDILFQATSDLTKHHEIDNDISNSMQGKCRTQYNVQWKA